MVFADKMHDIIGVLENDGVIIYPTDTIWGLGCSIFSEKALKKIQTLKGRISGDSTFLLCSSLEMLKKYVHRIHPRIETLLAYHERPLTIVYPKAKNLPSFAMSDDGSVAIRITTDPFSKTIIELLGSPLISTSANVEGNPTPSRYEDIDPSILRGSDYVCFHNRSAKYNDTPSVVASYDRKGELIFLRS